MGNYLSSKHNSVEMFISSPAIQNFENMRGSIVDHIQWLRVIEKCKALIHMFQQDLQHRGQ